MDDFRDQLIEQNRNEMRRINKIFTAAFFITAVPSLAVILGSLMDLLVAIMTVGIAKWTVGSMISLLLGVMLVIAALQAHQKQKHDIVITMVLLIAMFFAKLLFGGEVYTELIAMLAGCGAQIFTLAQFKALERLSRQDGYPDFNPIYYHYDPLPDEKILRPSRLAAENAEKTDKLPEDNDMQDISELPETDGDYSDYAEQEKRRREL